MKLTVAISLLMITSFIKAQVWCNPVNTPTLNYQSNTVSSLTTFLNNWYSLCGPNTIVYDTIIYTSHFVYVNSNCSLIFRQGGGPQPSIIWAKNNSTITILQGCAPVNIRHEPLTIIINQSTMTIDDSLCSSVSFPVLNCFTGIKEASLRQAIFKFYPNPSITKINIEFVNSTNQFAEIRIINQLNEIVYEKKQWAIIDKEISVDNLSNGSYFIQIKTRFGQQTEKLIILR